MLADDPKLNALTGAILGAAIEVHRVLGPGLLESIYLACFRIELGLRRLRFIEQTSVPVVYKDIRLNAAYRIDLTVEDQVIVEVKAVDTLLPVHQSQVVTYLKVTGYRAGLLINFNSVRLKDGVRRVLAPKP